MIVFFADADYRGSYGSAANTVVFPLAVAALVIIVMIGDGCCAFVCPNLGRGRLGNDKRSMGNAVLLSVPAGAVPAVASMLGGTVNGAGLAYSKVYLFGISPGIPFFKFERAMNSIIRADGSLRFAMASMPAGLL